MSHELSPSASSFFSPSRTLGIGLIAIGMLAIGAVTPAAAQGTFSFFGAQYTQDSVVFVLNRSSSMNLNSELGTAKAELALTIQNLPPAMRFAVVAYNQNLSETSPLLLPATLENRNAAIDFVNALTAAGAGCPEAAYTRAFEILEASGALFDLGDPIVLLVTSSNSCSPMLASSVEASLAANSGGALARAMILPSGWDTDIFHILVSAGSGPDSVRNEYLRGDANGDQLVNIADAIRILQFGFGIVQTPLCRDAADVAADGFFEPISDAVTLLAALFSPGAPPILAPFPDCAEEPEANGLTCYGNDCP